MGRDYIKQLTVGGFQVFGDPVTIPFGPLTLLYGPNSAGKSAILDAMQALAELCDIEVPPHAYMGAKRLRVASVLSRHWRREAVAPLTLAQELTLGATVNLRAAEWAEAGFAKREFVFGNLEPRAEFDRAFPALLRLAQSESLDLGVSILYCLTENGGLSIDSLAYAGEQRIKIHINGIPILAFEARAGVACINLDHPALVGWDAAVDIKWMAKQYEGAFVTDGGWFGTPISAIHNGWLGTNAVDAIAPHLSNNTRSRARAAETSFIEMFDALFRASMKSMSQVLGMHLVPASRSVPKRSDVTFLFDYAGRPLASERMGIQVNGLPEHLDITRAAFATQLSRPQKAGQSADDLFGRNLLGAESAPIDLINRLLSDYLFSSSGYFLSAGVHELTPVRSDDNDEIVPGLTNEFRQFLVSLELCDPAGRRFNFDEVGSGLGYVLPVLLAVATSRSTFLQQPELHLHPALQSQLADALVVALGDVDFGGKTSRGCHQIIVETHSEHLLLRLLRRIRQATKQELALDPHTIGREDVVVLYVNPRSDGSSEVKHLRISRTGEFIDRWPNGFFEERWSELFDE